MSGKAKQNVTLGITSLQSTVNTLQSALNSAEKPENKNTIQQAINSINTVQQQLTDFQD